MSDEFARLWPDVKFPPVVSSEYEAVRLQAEVGRLAMGALPVVMFQRDQLMRELEAERESHAATKAALLECQSELATERARSNG